MTQSSNTDKDTERVHRFWQGAPEIVRRSALVHLGYSGSYVHLPWGELQPYIKVDLASYLESLNEYGELSGPFIVGGK